MVLSGFLIKLATDIHLAGRSSGTTAASGAEQICPEAPDAGGSDQLPEWDHAAWKYLESGRLDDHNKRPFSIEKPCWKSTMVVDGKVTMGNPPMMWGAGVLIQNIDQHNRHHRTINLRTSWQQHQPRRSIHKIDCTLRQAPLRVIPNTRPGQVDHQ